MSKAVGASSKLVLLKCFQDGGLGAEPLLAGGYLGLGAKSPTAGRFFVIFWKKSYFNAIESHLARVQSHLKELDLNI